MNHLIQLEEKLDSIEFGVVSKTKKAIAKNIGPNRAKQVAKRRAMGPYDRVMTGSQKTIKHKGLHMIPGTRANKLKKLREIRRGQAEMRDYIYQNYK